MLFLLSKGRDDDVTGHIAGDVLPSVIPFWTFSGGEDNINPNIAEGVQTPVMWLLMYRGKRRTLLSVLQGV